ncbi:hypothetical protein SDC9_196698 [bioreactor metagenome]|uniref:Uncharacterized protein n=1 Tax=bioreactor metagenome TaxID=1076179 RepID=A0A645ICR0_9ZZZZ
MGPCHQFLDVLNFSDVAREIRDLSGMHGFQLFFHLSQFVLASAGEHNVRAFFDEFLRHRFAQPLTRSNDQCHFIL